MGGQREDMSRRGVNISRQAVAGHWTLYFVWDPFYTTSPLLHICDTTTTGSLRVKCEVDPKRTYCRGEVDKKESLMEPNENNLEVLA